MRVVVAIIRAQFLEEIAETLAASGIVGITATKVSGYGQEQRFRDPHQRMEHSTTLADNTALQPKFQVEIVVPDNRQEDVIQILDSIANTGKVGDGKIFIREMDNAVRIRDGSSGDIVL